MRQLNGKERHLSPSLPIFWIQAPQSIPCGGRRELAPSSSPMISTGVPESVHSTDMQTDTYNKYTHVVNIIKEVNTCSSQSVTHGNLHHLSFSFERDFVLTTLCYLTVCAFLISTLPYSFSDPLELKTNVSKTRAKKHAGFYSYRNPCYKLN